MDNTVQQSMRIVAIDRLRGLAIVSMVFFTLILLFSNTLPDLLRHNVPNSLHIGDFVLTMFLFTSGMSLVFFVRKHSKDSRYFLDIIERFGLFIMIWIFISPFSGGGFLQMDELMLSIILSIPTIILITCAEDLIAIAAVIPIIVYIIAMVGGFLPNFTNYYLGGYVAAFFYLPVMLGGALAGKMLDRIEKMVIPTIIATVLLLLVVPPYKLSASPSFMALSVLLSLILFMLVKRLDELKTGPVLSIIKPIEYLGSKPIRYWVMMWILIIIPTAFYIIKSGSDFPLHFSWVQAVLIAFGCLFFLYLVSLLIDFVVGVSRSRFRSV